MTLRLVNDLEFDKVLDIVAAHARTGMGRFVVCNAPAVPSFDEARAAARLTVETEKLIEDGGNLALAGLDEARPLLADHQPISIDPTDLLALVTLARRVATARDRLLASAEEMVALRDIGARLPDTRELVRWAAPRLGRDGQVPDDASPELRRLRARMARSRQQIVVQLEGIRRAHGDAAADAPPTIRHGRYCIAVRSSARAQLDGLVLDSSGSGATVFMEPFAAVEANNALTDAAAREREEVRRILAELAAAFADIRGELRTAIDLLAVLDAAQARALFGRTVAGRILEPVADGGLVLINARHPLLDQRLRGFRAELFNETESREAKREAVPLSFRLPEEVRTLVISGPNAGGKTVVLKTLGLMVLMAYHGIPLPVDEGSAIPWFDSIWCHIGDEQDVAADLSTFSGAMAATARLLERQRGRSLVLYDELGAGTDPLEGAALGCALLEELTRRDALTVATTHLAAISLNASSVVGMETAAMEYDEDRGRATYRLRLGRPGRSRGLEIAQSMGVDGEVLTRARELLGGQHLELDRWLGRLENLEAELLEEREEIRRQLAGARAEEERLSIERSRLQLERARVPVRLAEEVDRLQRRAKQQLDRALGELAAATRDQRPLGKRSQQQLRQRALELQVPTPDDNGDAPRELEAGRAVRLPTLGASGVVQELRGSQVQVAVGSKRLWVDRSELRTEEDGGPPERVAAVRVDAADSVPAELLLLGMDSEEARREIEQYLDRAFAAGCRVVRVVHGHGTGTLRKVVQEICREHPAVRSFRHPPGNRGGTGATEVTLEEI